MGFSRQEYWSGLPFPYPRDLPDPGIEPVSLLSSALTGVLLLLFCFFVFCLFVCLFVFTASAHNPKSWVSIMIPICKKEK